MTIDDKIRDGKQQYDINRDAEKRPALSVLLEILKNMSILAVEKNYLLIRVE